MCPFYFSYHKILLIYVGKKYSWFMFHSARGNLAIWFDSRKNICVLCWVVIILFVLLKIFENWDSFMLSSTITNTIMRVIQCYTSKFFHILIYHYSGMLSCTSENCQYIYKQKSDYLSHTTSYFIEYLYSKIKSHSHTLSNLLKNI